MDAFSQSNPPRRQKLDAGAPLPPVSEDNGFPSQSSAPRLASPRNPYSLDVTSQVSWPAHVRSLAFRPRGRFRSIPSRFIPLGNSSISGGASQRGPIQGDDLAVLPANQSARFEFLEDFVHQLPGHADHGRQLLLCQ
jgi:hypothetical protein